MCELCNKIDEKEYVSCPSCGGSGFQLNMFGEPDVCYECKGNTVVTVETDEDRIELLETELDEAIRVAYNHGAKEWVRLNYPDKFKALQI